MSHPGSSGHGKDASSQLPKEYVDWITNPVTRFFKIETAAGTVLLVFTVIALILANSPLSDQFRSLWHVNLGISIGSFDFKRSLHGWINDALMTLFFFLISLELKREIVFGEIHSPHLAALPIAAALGGMLVPAGVYLVFQYGESGHHGWGTVMATDTAFVIGSLALLGSRIPRSLRTFMLTLAVVDDIGAIIVVAAGYGSAINWIAVGCAVLGFIAVRVMAYLGIRSLALFFFAGSIIWIIVDASGVHPTATGVILGLMTPTKKWITDERLHNIMDSVVAYPPGDHWSGDTPDRRVLQTAEAAAREALSPVERLEMILHPWVGFFVMPLFALANAGISLTTENHITPLSIAIFLGFVVGKPLGVFLFSWSAVKLRIAALPTGLDWKVVLGGGFLAGIGFTMALFIANLAFQPTQLNGAKLAILSASIVSALLGALLLWRSSGSPKKPHKPGQNPILSIGENEKV